MNTQSETAAQAQSYIKKEPHQCRKKMTNQISLMVVQAQGHKELKMALSKWFPGHRRGTRAVQGAWLCLGAALGPQGDNGSVICPSGAFAPNALTFFWMPDLGCAQEMLPYISAMRFYGKSLSIDLSLTRLCCIETRLLFPAGWFVLWQLQERLMKNEKNVLAILAAIFHSVVLKPFVFLTSWGQRLREMDVTTCAHLEK